MHDQEALEALKRGDPAGMEALVAAHQLPALKLAYQITRDQQSAEDVVADSFLVVFEQRNRQDPARPFHPWFLRIVANRAITMTRRSGRLANLLQLLKPHDHSDDPAETADRNAEHREVVAALGRLPPKERAALTLRYLMDLDERAIADTLGWPIGTVKTRLHRGRNRLRRQLAADDPKSWAAAPAREELK
jgi:RNA polymerase sigma-70 factor (ECF subfamily)